MPWPFTLSGPDFLLFYGLAFVGCLFAAFLLKAMHVSLVSEESFEQRSELEPYELTFLSGGPELTLAAACARLETNGVLDLGRKGRKVQATDTLPEDAHGIEKAIVSATGKSGKASAAALRLRCKKELDRLKRSLVRGGYLLDPSRSLAFQALRVGPLVLLGLVGVIRLLRGLSNGRPVLFLAAFLVLTVVALIFLAGEEHTITERGKRALRGLKERNAALQESARSNWSALSGRDQIVATGLMGTAVLSESVLGLMSSMRRSQGGSGSSGLISSCGATCGSSCGASCGGGGCGGCGG